MIRNYLLKTLLVLMPATLFAQPIEQALTFDNALQNAYMLNPALKAAALNVRASEFSKRAAWGVHLPQLSVAGNYTYMSQDVGHFDLNNQKNQFVDLISSQLPLPPQIVGALKQMDFSYTLQKRDFAVVGANLMVPIYTGGKLNAVSNAGKIKYEQAKVEQKQAEHTVFTQISELYWGLALAQNVHALQNQLVKAMEMHLFDAEQLEANGMIAKGDKLFVEMSLSQARAALTSANGIKMTANAALSGAMSEKMQIKATQVIYTPVTPMFVAHYVEPLLYFKQQIADNSLALEQVELLKGLAKELVRAERADFVPQVAAIGGINAWDYNLTNQIPQWFVGAGVKWSIFDGLQREYRYSAARNQVRRVEQLQAKAEIDIQVLVEKLYSEMESARQQATASEATIEFAKEYLRIKNEAFKQEMASAADVMDAELNLSKALTERMAAAYKFDVSLAHLLALAGQSERFADYQNSTTTKIISIR